MRVSEKEQKQERENLGREEEFFPGPGQLTLLKAGKHLIEFS